MYNYDTSKEPKSKPPIEQVSEYRNSTRRGNEPAPPAAAQFNKGATSIEQIREATEARRRQSAEISNRPTGPKNPASNSDSRGDIGQ